MLKATLPDQLLCRKACGARERIVARLLSCTGTKRLRHDENETIRKPRSARDGAAAGIGKATAERLAAEGARLVIADYNYPEAERLAEQLNREGAPPSRCASTLPRRKAAGKSSPERSNGTERSTILVNNVGGSDLSRDLDLLNMDLGYFDEVFHLNLRSVMATTQAALSEMTLRNRGSIVNTASIGVRLGDFRGTLYGAAKAGVIGLTRYIASQYGKLGIRCNAVAPGLVLTPASTRSLPENVRSVFRKYNAVDYLGQAADIAATIAFLASDDARYVTGQTITADGGMDSHNPTVAELAGLSETAFREA